LDDWQRCALSCADWRPLQSRAEVVFFHEPLGGEDEAALKLAGFDVIMAMRERTAFPTSLIARLPNLKMFSLTGHRARSIDMVAMAERGVTVCGTNGGADHGAVTAELALGMMLAAARGIAQGDAAVRRGRFQLGTKPGVELEGKVLGLIGLGRIGGRLARYGTALGMTVLAWSQNLTAERASHAGALLVSKEDLLARADIVSLHLVLSDRTKGVLGSAELSRMKRRHSGEYVTRSAGRRDGANRRIAQGALDRGARRVRSGAVAGGPSADRPPEHAPDPASRIQQRRSPP